MLAIAILTVGILSRLFTPYPNFNPVIALAIFSGVYIKNKKLALLLPLLLMFISDLFLGFHSTIAFTWVGIVLVSMVGVYIREKKSVKSIFAASLASAVIFYVISNAGVWLMDAMYPMTWAGLAECFAMALPFFRMTLMSAFIYAFILFGVYELIAARVKTTRFAHVL
jgi:hypothetical protein